MNDSNVGEISIILNEYLHLFNHNCFDFKYHLISNSVLDWYGRNIRGVHKLHNYLRHEICDQFDHIAFKEPRICDHIETKISHMSTKILTNTSFDHIHPMNKLPHGIPQKTYAGSDSEDFESNEQKKNKSFLVRSQDKIDKDDDKSETFASLLYFEVEGILRVRSSAVQRMKGIWRRCNERRTRIRVSYRQSFNNHHIVFPLIIYEDLEEFVSYPKRNLMLEYEIINIVNCDEYEKYNNEEKRDVDFIKHKTHNPFTNLKSLSESSEVSEMFHEICKTSSLITELNTVDSHQLELNYIDITANIPQMCTPTKLMNSPPATPKRKPRPTCPKRLNSSPSLPSPKRCAARSLRL